MRRTIPLNNISGVGVNQKATLRIVEAHAFHGILFDFTNVTAAQIESLRVFYGDTEAMAFTGPDLDAINQYFELAPMGANGLLYVPFAAPGMLDQAEEEGTAVHVGVKYADGTVIPSIRVEIKLDNTVVNPGILAMGVVRDAVAGLAPWFPFVRQTTVEAQSGGVKAFNDIVDTKSGRESYCTQVFFKTNQISNLLVQRNGVDMFDRSVVINERIQANGVRTPQAGWFVFDTRENGYGNMADALDAGKANTLIWKPTFGAAVTAPAYVFTIGRLN
ncbi:hypothetical protein C3942_16875 [Solimonas fluminis]|uniref:Uncharacterized protein n=1 Tax=Solimonas fluminis TaxID=2086571 RepID=A0A2S5TCR8_9GAMM|nr:major capsid protein P2 [Solimonas fluminis]PPE72722.1 hypothetical protein C3942_16875 [Solimonas fluminis]